MDHDRNMIRIVEGFRAALECGVVEAPLRRAELPDQLREVVAILVVADPTALGRKIELVPPLELSRWRQGHCASLLVADQITAHRNHCAATLRPERGHDVRGSRTPVETGNHRLV